MLKKAVYQEMNTNYLTLKHPVLELHETSMNLTCFNYFIGKKLISQFFVLYHKRFTKSKLLQRS